MTAVMVESPDRHLEDLQQRVDAALLRSVNFTGADAVSQAAAYAVAGDGKRLRPVLVLAAVEAVGGVVTDTIGEAAAALELVHTYSLVHDDLPCMDDDDLRRGRATTHRVYGTGVAMVAGFALIPQACALLLDRAEAAGVSPDRSLRAVRELCRGAGAAGMVGGQVLDLEAEGNAAELAGLRRIHALKTGALFGAALRIGGLLGGGTEAQVEGLGEFGERLGLAFQITDDVLDVTMDADALGKTPGKDEAAAKSTFVSLLGLDGARAAAREEADAALAALAAAGIESPLLRGLAGFAVERQR